MKEFYFDVGLDPNHRIAEDAGLLAHDVSMFRLSRFAASCGLRGEADAQTIKSEAASADKNDGFLIGFSALRDCYGKVDYFFAPVNVPQFAGIAKVLKAYKTKTRIIAAVPEGTEHLNEAAAMLADETVHVKQDAADEAAAKLNETEHISIGPDSSAALCAMKDRALAEQNKHARYVVLFTD